MVSVMVILSLDVGWRFKNPIEIRFAMTLFCLLGTSRFLSLELTSMTIHTVQTA
jgi:hypothetical protein